MALRINTKKVLADAFAELLLTKDLSEITVKDITDHCGASRSVFYRYFKDKYSLAFWEFEEMTQHVLDDLNNGRIASIEEANRIRLQYLYDRKKYYERLLAYDGQNSFFHTYIDIFCKYSLAYAEYNIGKENISTEMEFLIRYHASAQGYVIGRWLSSTCKLPLDELARRIALSSSVYHDMVEPLRLKRLGSNKGA